MDIGEKIRSARLAKGMTQEELGNRLGVQKSAIAKYESGRVVNIKRSTLKKISEILDIRPAELIGDVPPNPHSPDERLLNAYHAADPIYQQIALELLESHPKKNEG